MKKYYLGLWYTKSFQDEDPWADADSFYNSDFEEPVVPNIVLASLSDNKSDTINAVLDDIFATGNYVRTAFRTQDDNGNPYTDAEIEDYVDFFDVNIIEYKNKDIKQLKDKLNKII